MQTLGLPPGNVGCRHKISTRWPAKVALDILEVGDEVVQVLEPCFDPTVFPVFRRGHGFFLLGQDMADVARTFHYQVCPYLLHRNWAVQNLGVAPELLAE